MKYGKVLSLALALSASLAYGMGNSVEGFKKYIRSIDPSARNFSEGEWAGAIANVLKPIIELAKEYNEDVTNVIGDKIANKELEQEYYSYRTSVLLGKIRANLNKLAPILEKEADLVAKGKKTQKEVEKYAKYERESRDYQNLVNQFIERYDRKPRSDYELRNFEEQLLEEEEEAFKREFENIPKRHERAAFKRGQEILSELNAKKKEAQRLKEEKKEAEEAFENTLRSSPLYKEKEQDLLNVEKEYTAKIVEVNALEAENEGLKRTTEELKRELEEREEELKQKQSDLDEAVRSYQVLMKQKKSPEEIKAKEEEEALQKARNAIIEIREEKAKTEGEVQGTQNALIVHEGAGITDKFLLTKYEKIINYFKVINARLNQVKNLEIEWFNGTENVAAFKAKLKDLLNLTNTSKSLRKKLMALAPLRVRFVQKPDIRSYKLMLETLRTIRSSLVEATKVAVNKPEEVQRIVRYNELTKALASSYITNFDPNVESTGFFAGTSAAEELNAAIERIEDLIARYEEA